VRLGIEAHYIDSATRVTGPSLTGRLLSRVPDVHRYAQHPGWGAGWHHLGSVLDGYEPVVSSTPARIRRAVVTLGTWRQDFRSLVERLRALLPADVDTLWQTGSTDVRGLGIRAHAWIPPSELRNALSEADLVVSHCGVGASLDALDAGKCAVVVPRRATRGEQVDDHQEQLAGALTARGLAVAADPHDLTLDVLLEAARHRVERTASPPPLVLARSATVPREEYGGARRRATQRVRRSMR
jgi:UDP-N-acetylglucosamine--N-acetylmuramyl-(pentapeptide) pyrophosphoryl-undecaprenol N-acetylglucosamine transferase